MNISHPVIEQILVAATDVLDIRVADWKKKYISDREIAIQKKADAKLLFESFPQYDSSREANIARKLYHSIYIAPEMCYLIEEGYRTDLQMDLIRAMAGYLYKTDKIVSEPVFDFEKGNLVLRMSIKRDGVVSSLFTQVILVWGEIKVPHYRYRVETELPKINAKPYLNWLQKRESIENDIIRMFNHIERYNLANEKAKNLTYEEFIKDAEFLKFLERESLKTQQEVDAFIKARFKNAKSVAWNNKEIKGYEKQILRQQTRLAAINTAAGM